MKKAVVLLSGGLDSSTVLAMAKKEGFQLYALTLIYGQRHDREVKSAQDIAGAIGVMEHRIMELPNGIFSGSSLTYDSDVPLDRDVSEVEGIPSTYVPARNLVFLSMAVSWAEAIDADTVFIGVTAIDYSGYPDCRKEFIEAFDKVQSLATRRGVLGNPIVIRTPIIDMSKADIIREGTALGIDYGLTWSCYTGGEKACGRCDTCSFRSNGFKEAGLEDPLEYEE